MYRTMKPCRTMKMLKSNNARRGVAAVEFAVIAPIVFLVIFGLMEMGRMVMVKQAVTNAAREGCREASLATTTSVTDVDTVVRDHLKNIVPNYLNTSKLRVTCTPASLSGITSGTACTVDVRVDFDDVSWVPGNFLGLPTTIEIRAMSTKDRE